MKVMKINDVIINEKYIIKKDTTLYRREQTNPSYVYRDNCAETSVIQVTRIEKIDDCFTKIFFDFSHGFDDYGEIIEPSSLIEGEVVEEEQPEIPSEKFLLF